MLDTRGRVMVPYGMTVYGLSEADYSAYTATDDAQIEHAASGWCTNFIRLQIAQTTLFSGAAYPKYNVGYLRAVETEVALAESLDQDVILSDQTEHVTGTHAGLEEPTSVTVDLWRVIDSVFHDQPRIWFDVFNEPRGLDNTESGWNTWLHGGNVGGTTYPGMQAIVVQLRSFTANLLLIEGPDGGKVLTLLGDHEVRGANLVYAVHPYREFTRQSWDVDFGNVAAGTKQIGGVPVIADEWNQHNGDRKNCTPSAPTMVPAFLSYLRAHGIGLGGWALVPGVLVVDDRSFTPTAIRSDYHCGLPRGENRLLRQQGASVKSAQGAGLLLQTYFDKYSGMRTPPGSS